MHEDERRRVELQRAPRHLAGIDGHVVDGALALRLVGDQHVLAVEEEDAELLGVAVGHHRAAVGHELVPGRDHRALDDARPRHAVREGLDDAELQPDLGRRARHLHQPVLGSGDDAVEVAEGGEERLGERLHVDALDGVEEQQLEKLVLRHRGVAAGEEALAQPLAVAPVVRAHRGDRAGVGLELGWLRRRQAQLEIVQAAQRLLGEAGWFVLFAGHRWPPANGRQGRPQR